MSGENKYFAKKILKWKIQGCIMMPLLTECFLWSKSFTKKIF